jgi:hypothetical protein
MTSDLPHEFSVRSTMYSEVLMLEKPMYNQLCEVVWTGLEARRDWLWGR